MAFSKEQERIGELMDNLVLTYKSLLKKSKDFYDEELEKEVKEQINKLGQPYRDMVWYSVFPEHFEMTQDDIDLYNEAMELLKNS